MARQSGAAIQNDFRKGLITQATGLNFPENACTDTDNCIFDLEGRAARRLGIDFEVSYGTKAIDRTGAAVVSYVWRNVGGDASVSFVAQVGATIYFWDLSQSGTVSAGTMASTVSLASFDATGAPDTSILECQFHDGNGVLFVTHRYCEPFYITFDGTSTFTGTAITIKIRDFKGVDDTLSDTQRPNTLSTSHRYNLGNQGWTSVWSATSATSVSIGTGSKGPFSTQSGLPITLGEKLRLYSSGSPTSYMVGVVTAYSGTSLTVNVTTTAGGAGPYTDWVIVQEPNYIQTWFDSQANYPGNSDAWWDFKNSSDAFDVTTIPNRDLRNARAPQGHFIVSAFDTDRDTVSGLSGLTDETSSYFRPQTVAFYSGRVFYAGVTASGYTSNIYFSQIIEDATQYGRCYQKNDPTSEDLFDLLPADGGVIKISDCGEIVKLWSMQGALIVFATNGIWAITGSQGIGFIANDYAVRKLSTINALAGGSFVPLAGYPVWWNAESIYTLKPTENEALTVASLTNTTIMDFYQEIPLSSRAQAKGAYNLIDSTIQWVYRSTEATSVVEAYSFDRVLVFDALTGALYPWTFATGTPTVNGICVSEGFSTSRTANQVTSGGGANTVQDSLGNNVVTYELTGGSTSPQFKYFVSYASGGSYEMTFALTYNEDYLDWYSYDTTGVDYESYFIAGYKVHGDAQRKFQSNYLYLFSDAVPSQYTVQGRWNWSGSTSSGKWTTAQTVTPTDTNYSVVTNRLKIGGEGLSLQFKITSTAGNPFSLIGWSGFETANARP